MADALAPTRCSVQRHERIARNTLHLFTGLFIVLALVFAALAAWQGDSFYLRLATEALILGGLAMSVDILLGYTGLLSLGQALYFGLGAYTSALVLRDLAPSFWLAMGITLVMATVVGLIAGVISLRARGVYFALITFGLAQVLSRAIYNTRELGASDGLIGIPVIDIPFGLFSVGAGDPLGFFLLVLTLIMMMYFAVSYLMQTPFGRLLMAIRTNEHRVPFLGFNPWRAKLIAFVLSVNIAALSGALYPMLRGFVSPELMFFQTSGNAVITVILGGTGTLIGPLYGSVILTVLKSVIGTLTEHHLIVIGGLFMIAVIFFPKGLIGYLQPLLTRWLNRGTGND